MLSNQSIKAKKSKTEGQRKGQKNHAEKEVKAEAKNLESTTALPKNVLSTSVNHGLYSRRNLCTATDRCFTSKRSLQPLIPGLDWTWLGVKGYSRLFSYSQISDFANSVARKQLQEARINLKYFFP